MMKDKAKYPVSNGHHEIEECQVFFSQTIEGRSLVISLKNTMEKFVTIEGCAKFALDDTPQHRTI